MISGAASTAGQQCGQIVANYVHVHLGSNPRIARNLLDAALAVRAAG